MNAQVNTRSGTDIRKRLQKKKVQKLWKDIQEQKSGLFLLEGYSGHQT